jgi:hypothetical protein
MTTVTGNLVTSNIANRRQNMTYKVSTTALTGKGVVPIKGGKHYPKEPTIYFTREAWVKQCHLVDKCTKEVGWFALVDYDPTDESFTIDEIVIPVQTVTATETDIGKEALADAAMALIEQGKDTSRMYAWFHSHVNMGVGPSGQDEYQVEDFLEDLADQPTIPAFIRGIQNKKGDLKLDVYYVQHGIAFQNVDHYVLYDDDPQWAKDVDALIKENVKDPVTYAPYTYPGVGYKPPAGKLNTGHGNGANTEKSERNSGGFRDYKGGGYGGYAPGYRNGYPYWDEYDDAYDTVYGGLGTAVALTQLAEDVPDLPLPVVMSTADQYNMEVVYNGKGNTEVLLDTDGHLYICDAKGDVYDYEEYTETFGDVGAPTAFHYD